MSDDGNCSKNGQGNTSCLKFGGSFFLVWDLTSNKRSHVVVAADGKPICIGVLLHIDRDKQALCYLTLGEGQRVLESEFYINLSRLNRCNIKVVA